MMNYKACTSATSDDLSASAIAVTGHVRIYAFTVTSSAAADEFSMTTTPTATVIDTADVAVTAPVAVSIPPGWDLPGGFTLSGEATSSATVFYTIEA